MTLDELVVVPCTIRGAQAFVAQHHRHHGAPTGALFALALAKGATMVGVALVGRPVARHLQDGVTAEVTRLCVLPGTPNACSKLYAHARQAAKALGYHRIITYTLASEPGTSLRAAGWRRDAKTKGGSWNCPSRPRTDHASIEPKVRWLAQLVSDDDAAGSLEHVA